MHSHNPGVLRKAHAPGSGRGEAAMAYVRAVSRTAIAAALPAAGFLLTACSASPVPVPRVASPTSVPLSVAATAKPTADTSSPAADAAGQAALTSYTKMWTTSEDDARGGTYNILELSAYVTGKPLQLFSQNLATWHAEGAVIKGDIATSPTITSEAPSTSPTTVQITDRFDDSKALLYYSATGALVNDKPGGCHLVHATVTDMSGVWRVTSLEIGSAGSCPSH
jgi:hypothetical protein